MRTLSQVLDIVPVWSKFAVAAAAALAATAYIWTKWIVPAARAVGVAWRALTAFGQKLETLDDIASEFKPNHGTSLRDTIDRIEAAVHDHGTWIVTANERLERIEQRLAGSTQ